MKKLLFPLLMVGTLAYTSCTGPKADKAEVTDAVEVTEKSGNAIPLNLNESVIDWAGSKLLGKTHNGTLNISKGEVIIENGELVGGSFVMDMNTITPLDQDDEWNGKLRAHLLADDFFGVEEHPESYLTITGVEPIADASDLEMTDATHFVSGNLNIRGIEKNVKIPAKLDVSDNGLIAFAEFNLIRTDFNVMFGTEDDPDFKDDFIKNEINLKINLNATM